MTADVDQEIREGMVETYKELLIGNFKASSDLMSLMAILLRKNENVGINFGMQRGGDRFPPNENDSNLGAVNIGVFLRDKDADIYWPNSTNHVHVAQITINSAGKVVVAMRDFQKWHCPDEDYWRISQYHCLDDTGPTRYDDVQEKVVEKMFTSVQDDIRKIFTECHIVDY